MATTEAHTREAQLEEVFLEASRALVGIAVRSVAQAPVDLTVAQYRVLVILDSGSDHSVGDVSTALGVDHSNATRHCDRLQRLGLVERSRSPIDGRVVMVSLTSAGREVIETVTDHRRRQVQAVFEEMSESAARGAVRAMRAFNRAASGLDRELDVRQRLVRCSPARSG